MMTAGFSPDGRHLCGDLNDGWQEKHLEVSLFWGT
jgi:hypothetical protein